MILRSSLTDCLDSAVAKGGSMQSTTELRADNAAEIADPTRVR
jgi:hypothetical protein